jgi:uncharacterized membrane protein
VSLSFVFLVFIVYSVVGWVSEVAYCLAVVDHKLVNRGFLHGPLCPIYGFGGLLVIYLLAPYKDSLPTLFVMAVVWTTVLEYLTSWALETVFSTKWWDYSDMRFNLHGRICLRNSLLFGLMAVLVVYFVHPAVVGFLALFAQRTLDVAASVLGIVLVVDLVLTLKTLIHIDEKLVALKELMETLRESVGLHSWFNEYDLRGSLARLKLLSPGDASGSLERLAARFEDMLAHTGGMLRIFKAFPSMQSNRHAAQLDIFKRLKDLGERIGDIAAYPFTEETAHVEARRARGAVSSDLGFATRFGFYRVFWIFLTAGFAGVVLESLWCVVTRGYLESRTGFIYGLFNPVYGIGGALMSAFFTRREKSRDLRVFVDNVLIGGAFEYVASLVQELVFGSVSWGYSGMWFNINVRTNLLYALMWGFLGLLWVREVYPALSRLIARIPIKVGKALSIALFAFLLADGAVSAVAVYRWSERERGVAASNTVERFADERYPDAYLRKIYPNMVFVRKKPATEPVLLLSPAPAH